MPEFPAGCRWLDIPKAIDDRGQLSFLEAGSSLPFMVQRIYHFLDVPAWAERGGHAHRSQQQIIMALAGSFELHLDDGMGKTVTVTLNDPNRAFLFGPLHWNVLRHFSPAAIGVMLCSAAFREDDYIRDHQIFLRERNGTIPG